MEIIQQLLANSGILERILGKDYDNIIYDKDIENVKRLLIAVYGYKDIEAIFTKQPDERKFFDVYQTTFRYSIEKSENDNK